MKNPQAFPSNDGMMKDGMTLETYAAIKLKQPISEYDWINEAIIKANIDHFAGQIMIATMSNDRLLRELRNDSKDSKLGVERFIAEHCYIYAEVMLEEKEERL